MSFFIPIPKKGNAKECSNYHIIAHFTCQPGNTQNSSSYASAVCDLRTSKCTSQIQKDRGTRDQIVNIHWIIEKARDSRKASTSASLIILNFCLDHSKLWTILKQMEIPDHFTCLLRNLYSTQEATVRTRHQTANSLQIWKRVCPGCILSPFLFKLYAEYIM